MSLNYKLVYDQTPSAPSGAVLATTIFDRQAQDWLDFEAHLPEKARLALSSSDNLKSITLFAVPDGVGNLEWGSLEKPGSFQIQSNKRVLRLVPKGVSAVGFISYGGHAVPLTATVIRGLIQAKVGYEFRGLNLDANPFAGARRLLVPIEKQSIFIEKPAGASWGRLPSALASSLQRFQAQGDLWNLPGRLEVAVSASETAPLNPFLVYYKPKSGDTLAIPRLETYARTLLSGVEPTKFLVALPDATKMTELRLDPSSIVATPIKVKGFGERVRFSAPSRAGRIELFSTKSGESWLSDDLNLIQGSLVASVGSKQSTDECEMSGKDGFASVSSVQPGMAPYLTGLERLTFSFHSLESGLFTTCGYFTP